MLYADYPVIFLTKIIRLLEGPELQQADSAGQRHSPLSHQPHCSQGEERQPASLVILGLSSLLSIIVGQQQQDYLH